MTSFENVPHFSLSEAPLFFKPRPTKIMASTAPFLNKSRTSLMYLTVWISTRSHVFPAPVNNAQDVDLPSIASDGD